MERPQTEADETSTPLSDNPLPGRTCQGARFAALAILWAAVLLFCGRQFSTLSGLVVFVLVVVLSVPALLASLYFVSVRKTRNLAGFAARGWLYRLLGGRVLATVLGTLFAVTGSFFIWLQLRNYGGSEWLGLFIVIPVFYACYRLLLRSMRRELKPYRQVAVALQLARWVVPLLMLPLYAAVLALTADERHFATVAEAIELVSPGVPAPGSSALVYELSHWLAYYDGARLFLFSELAMQGPWWSGVVTAVGSWLLFFSATSILACFLIPARELRRVFAPLSAADQAPAPQFGRIVLTSALSVLVVAFIIFPAFVGLEAQAQQRAAASAALRQQLDKVVLYIDGHYYRPALAQELGILQSKLTRQLNALEPVLEASREQAFAAMEANVESFLDWYYTLTAEYVRTVKLLSGGLEDHFAAQLRQHLLQGAPFATYEQQLAQVLALQQELQQQFSVERAHLLEQHRLPAGAEVSATRILAMDPAEWLVLPPDTIPFALRSGGGAGTGAISAIVTGKVVAKLYAKGSLKLAAKPFAKLAAGRAATAAAGAAAGAGIGSVVPGPGTVLGGVIGGGIGLGVGVITDFLLLKGEERLGRDQLREELLSAIAEAKQEH